MIRDAWVAFACICGATLVLIAFVAVATP